MPRAEPSFPSEGEGRAMLAVGLVVLVIVVAHVLSLYRPNTWINRDGRFYTNMNVTLVEDLSLEQSRFASSWYNGKLGWNYQLPSNFTNIAVGRHGEHWPMHPWLMPVLATPLFFAFDLLGTLLFNVLMFGIIGGAAYRFAREYASPSSAAIAAGVFLLGTSVHEYAYDYHVDVLLLALWASALAALVTRRGLILGACVAAMLVIKPTSLMLVPAVLLLLWERRDLKSVKAAFPAGAVVLAIVACMNTYLFGRPWWFGYNRVLTVVDGQPTVDNVAGAFDVPFETGIREVWSGYWGLRHRQTLMALALPGLFVLFRRAPRYALAAALTLCASLFVFAKYKYPGDRFHWPSIALLVPALGATFDLLAEGVSRAIERLRKRARVEHDVAAIVAALAVAASMIAALPFGPPPTSRVPDDGYAMGAIAYGRGTFDLRDDATSEREVRAGAVQDSHVARGRFGQWLPRASPLAVVSATPWAAVLGRRGLLVFHILAAFVAAFAAARVAARVAPAPIAAIAVAGPFMLPPLRDAALAGGPPLLSATCALVAIACALEARWITAGVLGALAAWMADAPWLVLVGVLIVAALDGRRALVRCAAASAIVLLVWCVTHLVIIGRPFASPEAFVVGWDGADFTTVDVSFGNVFAAVKDEATKGALRSTEWLLAFGLFGWLMMAWRTSERRVAILVASGIALMLLPGVLTRADALRLPSLALVLLAAIPVAAFVARSSDAVMSELASWRIRTRWLAFAGLLLSLLCVGTVHRIAIAQAPFRIESDRALRSAEVKLGEVPCDFLAWEQMVWECSHYDRGRMNMVGLALPDGLSVRGKHVAMLLVPTGSGARVRSVRFADILAGDTLTLRHAIPDGLNGPVEVTVLLDGSEVDRFVSGDDGQTSVRTRRIDTARFRGKRVLLILEARSRRAFPAGVGLAGGWD